SALTTSLGPVLGGWLTDAWSWRAIFFINVPVAAAAIAITLWHTPETHDRVSGHHLDWVGAILAVVGLGGVASALTLASDAEWLDPFVIRSLLVGSAVLVAFVWFESRTPTPMMPLPLF